jgi:hypothetical protein
MGPGDRTIRRTVGVDALGQVAHELVLPLALEPAPLVRGMSWWNATMMLELAERWVLDDERRLEAPLAAALRVVVGSAPACWQFLCAEEAARVARKLRDIGARVDVLAPPPGEPGLLIVGSRRPNLLAEIAGQLTPWLEQAVRPLVPARRLRLLDEIVARLEALGASRPAEALATRSAGSATGAVLGLPGELLVAQLFARVPR